MRFVRLRRKQSRIQRIDACARAVVDRIDAVDFQYRHAAQQIHRRIDRRRAGIGIGHDDVTWWFVWADRPRRAVTRRRAALRQVLPVTGRHREVKPVLVVSGRRCCGRSQHVEVGSGRIQRRVRVGDFVEPQVQIVAPRAQPVVFAQYRAGFVGIRDARDRILAATRHRALRGVRTCGTEHAGHPGRRRTAAAPAAAAAASTTGQTGRNEANQQSGT